MSTPQGTAAAVNQLIENLKGINGGPTFHHHLGGRVYNRLWLPTERTSKMPYLSVILADDGLVYDQEDESLVRQRFHVRIFGFVQETASSAVDGKALTDICNLHDDVVKRILQDWRLGEKAHNCTLLGGYRQAGLKQGWAEMEQQLEIQLYHAVESLGP